jgi:hypothetical protein
MQRLLLAEDALAREISLLLQITRNPDVVAPHISPAIQAQLSGSYHLILDSLLPLTTSQEPPSPAVCEAKVSVSPLTEHSVNLPEKPEKRNLVSFPHQMKQRRHEAYGVR